MPYSAGIPKRGSQVDVNPGVGEAFGASHSLTVDLKVYSTNTMVSGNPVAVTTTLCGKVIYTTNAIESINMSLRKVIKTRSSFPTDEAVTKLFYLALRNISKKWTMPIRDWKAALNRFSIQFEDRISSS